VSGLAGLLFSCKGATNASVRKAIESSCDPVGNWVSRGRIDAAKALAAIGCNVERREFSPSGFEMSQGQNVAAPENSLVYSDDKRLVLRSKGLGYMSVLDFYVSAKGMTKAGAVSLEVDLEANFVNPGEITAYFFDWAGNKWDWIGKAYLDSEDKKVSFARANPAAYISDGGEVRVRFYRQDKRWKGFELGADYVRFIVTKKEGK
jgi:thermitase